MVNQIIVKWITVRINVWSSETILHEFFLEKQNYGLVSRFIRLAFLRFIKRPKWITKYTDSARN